MAKIINFERAKKFPRKEIVRFAKELLPVLIDFETEDFKIGMQSCYDWLKVNSINQTEHYQLEAVSYHQAGVKKVYTCIPDFIEAMINKGHTNLEPVVIMTVFLSTFGDITKPKNVFVKESVANKLFEKYQQITKFQSH